MTRSSARNRPSPSRPPGVGAWPTFLVIGAGKCGTTSLHHYLRHHPDVGMTAEKELSFFAVEQAWSRGSDWYRAWFSPDDPVRGDVSPAYADAPRHDGVPERIHALVPDVKLVYLVRDPVDRAIARYRHRWSAGQESRPLAQAVDESAELYLAASRYHAQVERYLPYFGRDRFLVVAREDLLDRRRATLRRIFAFVGADPDVWDSRFAVRHHRTGDRRRMTTRGRQIAASRPFRALEALPPGFRWHVERAVLRPFSVPTPVPTVSPALRRQLAESLAEDVARFRAWAGQPFASWTL